VFLLEMDGKDDEPNRTMDPRDALRPTHCTVYKSSRSVRSTSNSRRLTILTMLNVPQRNFFNNPDFGIKLQREVLLILVIPESP